ncbi:hypothetical protein JCM6882_005671 [Rhodosporidiobolus microsporus]
MRCSRTANCKGCQARGIDRTSEEVTIDEQEREIQRLNRLVRDLRQRILQLGGRGNDLLLGENEAAPADAARPSSSASSSWRGRGPSPEAEPAAAIVSSTSSSPLPSPATSTASTDFGPAPDDDNFRFPVSKLDDLRLLPESRPPSRHPSLEPPPVLFAGPPRLPPPTTPYIFPAPSLSPAESINPANLSFPAPSSAYPFPLPTSTVPTSPISPFPSFPTFAPPAPGPSLRLSINTSRLNPSTPSGPSSVTETGGSVSASNGGSPHCMSRYGADYFAGADSLDHVRMRTM